MADTIHAVLDRIEAQQRDLNSMEGADDALSAQTDRATLRRSISPAEPLWCPIRAATIQTAKGVEKACVRSC
jgi:hypothetical protein